MEQVRLAEGQGRLWEHFEIAVRNLVASLDSNSVVTHNKRVKGLHSRALRQMDVWVEGKVGGLDVNVGVECKKHGRVVDVGTVDAFIGKLLDIGADKGVIYSHSGFSATAATRAFSARNPAVLALSLEVPLVMECVIASASVTIEEVSVQWASAVSATDYRGFLEKGEWPDGSLDEF